MSKAKDIWAALEPYRDRRIVATFGLGMSSGFPLTFVISLLGIWLSRESVSKSDVGLFALITTFYTWKFLWSPAIDRLPLGPVTRFFGQRRGWLFTNQARTILGAPSGFVAEAVGWVEFFLYATAVAIPGLILLLILWKKDVGTGTLADGGGKADI
ncbi:hypothetical protein [Kordiimonas sp.]|uniref:hypothetical protein n=1 Tax=Kordiimonas sp. TaxID=1970157 RepID=UPI003A8E7B9F